MTVGEPSVRPPPAGSVVRVIGPVPRVPSPTPTPRAVVTASSRGATTYRSTTIVTATGPTRGRVAGPRVLGRLCPSPSGVGAPRPRDHRRSNRHRCTDRDPLDPTPVPDQIGSAVSVRETPPTTCVYLRPILELTLRRGLIGKDRVRGGKGISHGIPGLSGKFEELVTPMTTS